MQFDQPELYASGLEQPYEKKQAKRQKRRNFLDQIVDPMDSAAAMDAAQQANVTSESGGSMPAETGGGGAAEGAMSLTGMGGGGSSPFKFANRTGGQGEGQVQQTGFGDGTIMNQMLGIGGGGGGQQRQQQCRILPDGTNSCTGQRGVSSGVTSGGVVQGGTPSLMPQDAEYAGATPEEQKNIAEQVVERAFKNTDPNTSMATAGAGLAFQRENLDQENTRQLMKERAAGVADARATVREAIRVERTTTVGGRADNLEQRRRELTSGIDADGQINQSNINDYVEEYASYAFDNATANGTLQGEDNSEERLAQMEIFKEAGMTEALAAANAHQFMNLEIFAEQFGKGSTEFNEASKQVYKNIARTLAQQGLADTKEEAARNFEIIAAPSIKSGMYMALESTAKQNGGFIEHRGKMIKLEGDEDRQKQLLQTYAMVKGNAVAKTLYDEMVPILGAARDKVVQENLNKGLAELAGTAPKKRGVSGISKAAKSKPKPDNPADLKEQPPKEVTDNADVGEPPKKKSKKKEDSISRMDIRNKNTT